MAIHLSNPSINPILDSWQVKDGPDVKSFSIQKAKIEDQAKIVKVVQEAYFHEDIIKATNRNPEKKGDYAVRDVPRRINTPENYTVLVCKVKEAAEERVVGTVYYQWRDTDFVDENEKELAELGLLAVDPKFWKKYNIGQRFIKTAVGLAEKDKMRGIYLYAIGSRIPGIGFSNHLLGFYEKNGFRFVENWISTPQKNVYKTPDGRVNMVVMLNDLSKRTNQKSLHTMVGIESRRMLKILPTNNGDSGIRRFINSLIQAIIKFKKSHFQRSP